MLRRFYSHHRGFSLLELMICSALVAIITLMSLPDLNRAKHREALRQAVATTEQLLANAAARATSTGSTTMASLTARSGRLHWQLHNRAGETLFSEPLALGVTLHSANVASELSSPTAPRSSEPLLATVTYYPTGAASPGALLLSAGIFRCRIVQPLRGAIHVEWVE